LKKLGGALTGTIDRQELSVPLERAASVIDLLAKHSGGLTVTQISDALGLPQPSAYRVVRRLAAIGYIEPSELANLYVIGPRLQHLAATLGETGRSDIVVGVLLQQLADTAGMTAYLAALAGSRVVLIDAKPPATNSGPSVYPGNVFPTHATACGRAILAFQPEAAIADFLSAAPFERFSLHTVSDADGLSRILASVRKKGVAVMRSELANGTWAAATPVFTGKAVDFAIGVVAFESAVAEDAAALRKVLPLLKRAAADIATRLPGKTAPRFMRA
jgi:DNA-binding IclR family transcriptional regulator